MATVVAGAAVGAGTAAADTPVGPPADATAVVGTDSATCDSDFTTINEAITAAAVDDTIYVCPGTYPEAVNITKNLTLLGAQYGTNATSGRTDASQETIVQAPSGSDFKYSGKATTTGTIDGFSILGDSDNPGNVTGIAASQFRSLTGLTFNNNIIKHALSGILLDADGTTPTTIQGNVITSNTREGIRTGTSTPKAVLEAHKAHWRRT